MDGGSATLIYGAITLVSLAGLIMLANYVRDHAKEFKEE